MPEEKGESINSNSFSKPGFDGRLQYYEVLKKYMMGIATASLESDYLAWLRLLNGLFALVKAFVPNQGKDIKNKLISVKSNFANYNSGVMNDNINRSLVLSTLDDELQEITECLFVSAKHMFLPTSEDGEDEFDMKDFMQGSDL